MRPISFCFFFLLITNLASSQTPENADSIIKKNNIIKETVVLYWYKKNVLQDTSNFRFELLFNSEGKLIEKKVINKFDKTMSTDVFYYNEEGKLAKNEMYFGPDKLIALITNTYQYNSFGNETSSTTFSYRGIGPPSDTILIKDEARRIYNGNNQLLEVFCTTNNEKNDTLYKNRQYAYNNDGKIYKEFYFNQNVNFNCSQTYLYKKNGDVVIYRQLGTSQPYVFSEWFYNRNKQF